MRYLFPTFWILKKCGLTLGSNTIIFQTLFYRSEKTIHRMVKKKKKIANHISNKGFVSKMQKEFLSLKWPKLKMGKAIFPKKIHK